MAPPRAGVFQLAVREPGRGTLWVPIGRFPFRVGRSADNELVLDLPGIWDRHLEFRLERDEGLVAVANSQGLVRHAGVLVDRRVVQAGDEFEVGPVSLHVALAPPLRRSLRVWEVLLWMLLVGVLILQLGVALWLLQERF